MVNRFLSKALLLFACCLSFSLTADIINPGSHSVGSCVKITNLDEFPIKVVLVVSGPGGGGTLNGEFFTPDSCKGTIYWACQTKLFWTTEAYLNSVGMAGLVASDVVKSAFGMQVLQKTQVVEPSVHLLSDSIRFYHSAVPDANPLNSIVWLYTIIKAGTNYGIYLSKQISYFSNKTSESKTFDPPQTGIILAGPEQSTPDRAFTISWNKNYLDITSMRPVQTEGGIVDGKGRTVLQLRHNYFRGEQVRYPLRSLPTGVYFLFLKTPSGPIAQKFSVIGSMTGPQ